MNITNEQETALLQAQQEFHRTTGCRIHQRFIEDSGCRLCAKTLQEAHDKYFEKRLEILNVNK